MEKQAGAEERAGTFGGRQDTTLLAFPFSKINNGHHCARETRTCSVLVLLISHFCGTFPSSWAGGNGRREKEREKREISHDFFGASQPGSQPVHHEASHPASKQANQFIPFSGATGTGPSNGTEQRATVLHHFLSERPRRLQLLIARLCQSAAQGLQQPGLFTACSHYITPLCSAGIQAGVSFQVHKRSRYMSKE